VLYASTRVTWQSLCISLTLNDHFPYLENINNFRVDLELVKFFHLARRNYITSLIISTVHYFRLILKKCWLHMLIHPYSQQNKFDILKLDTQFQGWVFICSMIWWILWWHPIKVAKWNSLIKISSTSTSATSSF